MPYSMVELNQMSQAAFTVVLGDIFEHSPAIAEQAWYHRPFSDLADLHQKMVKVVQAFDPAAKVALIQAHPDLGCKAKMAEASVKEQAGVGLDQLSAAEYERFQQLNQDYRQKFGFPFIIAVRTHTRSSILAAFEQRLTHDMETEMQQALAEIFQITRFRLQDIILEP